MVLASFWITAWCGRYYTLSGVPNSNTLSIIPTSVCSFIIASYGFKFSGLLFNLLICPFRHLKLLQWLLGSGICPSFQRTPTSYLSSKMKLHLLTPRWPCFLLLQPRTKLLRKFDVFFPMRVIHQCHKIKTNSPLPSPMQCYFGVKTNPDNSCVTQNNIERGEGGVQLFL